MQNKLLPPHFGRSPKKFTSFKNWQRIEKGMRKKKPRKGRGSRGKSKSLSTLALRAIIKIRVLAPAKTRLNLICEFIALQDKPLNFYFLSYSLPRLNKKPLINNITGC